MTCLVYSVSFLINITKLFKNQENLKSFKLNENRLELNWTKFVMYNRLMNPKERTHLDGKATKCDYLRRKNKLLSKSRELKRLSDLLMLELKVREKWNIRTTSSVSIWRQIDFWSTRMMSIWCLFEIFCCKVKKLSDLLMLELKVGESEISKWHHLRRSEVRLTPDQRTWCQYDVVLTSLAARWWDCLTCSY